MKRTYHNLYTRRITVGCQPFMQTMSTQSIKAKTKVEEWHEDGEAHEMGISDIELSTGLEP